MYFYCKYKDEPRSDAATILRSLVKQLCDGWPEGILPRAVIDIYETREDNGILTSPLTVEECRDLLIELSGGFRRTTILIDALDESPVSTKGILLDVLEHLERFAPNLVKILVTSRDDRLIRNRLGAFPTVSIQVEDTAGDIKHCAASAVQECIVRGQLLDGLVSTELKNHIVHDLENQSNGSYVFIFLLAKYQDSKI